MKFLKTTTLKLSLLFFTVCVISCSPDNDNDSTLSADLTEEEAVEIIENSIQKSTGGITEDVEKFAEELEEEIIVNLECNILYEDDFLFEYENQNLSVSYSVEWDYIMTCNELNIPQTVTFNFNTDGQYSTPRIESTDSSTASFAVSGLQPSASSIVFSGNFNREGNQIFTVASGKATQSTIQITLSNLTVNKENYTIISGEGLVQIEGSSQGSSYSFEGSIIFNGNGSATIIVNGTTYTINIA